MSFKTSCGTFAALLLALTWSAPSVVAQEGWEVAPRFVPPPAAASKALHALVATGLSPDRESRSHVPASTQEWRALIASRAAARKVSLPQLGQQLNVGIARETLGGVPVHRVQPMSVTPENRERLFMYLHGGAYVFGGGDASVLEGAMISALSGIPAVSVDYRMPPDHPSPAAIEDGVAVYRELLKTHEAGAIAIGGTSAGGGLTVSVVQALKQAGLPLPGALYLGTPWTDLSKTSDTLYTNEGIDRVLVTYDGLLHAAAQLYAGQRSLKDPVVSPVYGDFSGFPPTYLVTGTRDMLLSDTVRVHRKLRQNGILADLNVYEGMSHAEYAMVMGAPEWQQAYDELSLFLQTHLAPPRQRVAP